jgi:hypothetical protein
MIKPEQIPDEVVWKLHDKLWEVGNPSVAEARTALAAVLNTWPWAKEEARPNITFDGKPITVHYLILPLTEASDE